MRIFAAVTAIAAVLGSTAVAAQAPTAAKPPAATPAPPVTQVRAANTVVSTYRINPGDGLDIYVWGDERLQRGMSVLPDGTFAFPLAGTVMAAGRTANQLEAELSRLLAPQYKGVEPQVTVSVRGTSGMQISVIGKVRSPGSFSPNRYLSVLDVLVLAGGPSDFADLGGIVILRRSGAKLEMLHVKVGNLLKGKPSEVDLDGAGNPQLIAGDTVVVP